MKKLIYYTEMIFKALLPGGLPRLLEMVKPKPLHARIKNYYIEHGYEWSDDINLMTIRDTTHPNTYNDIHIVEMAGKMRFFWGTSEPGLNWTVAQMNKYNISWVGLYPLGFYPNNFRVGRHSGRALKQVGKVMLMYIKDGKKIRLRKGGNCDFHRRFSKGVHIGASSAGCPVPKSEKSMDDIVDLVESSKSYKKNKRFLLDYMIADIKDFPNLTGNEYIQG